MSKYKTSPVFNELLAFFPEGGVGLVPKRGCLLFTLAYYAFPRWYEFGERRWSGIDRGKLKNSERNQSQCHFFHHKSHTDWPGRKTRAQNPGLYHRYSVLPIHFHAFLGVENFTTMVRSACVPTVYEVFRNAKSLRNTDISDEELHFVKVVLFVASEYDWGWFLKCTYLTSWYRSLKL
jgi:hypothetical protein